jgi:DNA-binding NarL/FixJ family response regulator
MANSDHDQFERLSRRERQVLSALMRGETARDISRQSFVSLPTVRSQIRSILVKLGVSSQLGAVVLAYRSGWNGERGTGSPDEPDRLAVGM